MKDPVEKWMTIASKLLIPIVIAGGAWWVQRSISEQAAATQYVAIAVSILSNKEQKEDMREWAVRVLDKYSAVPLSQPLQAQLVNGEVDLDSLRSYLGEFQKGRVFEATPELYIIDQNFYEWLRAKQKQDENGQPPTP